MKLMFRFLITCFTALLIVSLIGCGGDDEMDNDDVDDMDKTEITSEFVGTTWQVVTVDGLMFDQLFTPAEPEPEFETEFMVGANSWTFKADGTFTGSLEFVLTEKYPEPVSSMTQEITIASEGTYTADESMLSIATHDVSVDVVVSLEPEEVWQQQIVGKTVEELEMDLAAETKLGFAPTATGALFKAGTEYTWSLDGDKLMLSADGRKMGLERKSE